MLVTSFADCSGKSQRTVVFWQCNKYKQDIFLTHKLYCCFAIKHHIFFYYVMLDFYFLNYFEKSSYIIQPELHTKKNIFILKLVKYVWD